MSIVEKMARAHSRGLWSSLTAAGKREEIARMRAALTATGLTEAQLEGLAAGTHVITRREPQKQTLVMVSAVLRPWLAPGGNATELIQVIYRAMLAAKEG